MLAPLLSLLISAASAAGLHSGVAVEALAGFEPPRHQSSREGLSLDFEGGIARVYVGPSVPAAQEWFAEKAAFVARQSPTPLDGVGDEALHAGDAMVLVRDGNVALLVQVKAGARAATDTLLQAIDDSGAPAPAAATLARGAGGHVLTAPGATHIAWVGGRLAAEGPGLRFTVPPRRVVTWGPLGRATVQAFDPEGAPVSGPPPRPGPDFVPAATAAP